MSEAMAVNDKSPLMFSLNNHPLAESLSKAIGGQPGEFNARQFPDGESYLRIQSDVENRACIVVADLSHPNIKYLPLLFLLETLRELGASQVGLVAPYLSYMRQDRRFVDGEAVTSRIFAKCLSQHADWLVTVDPHLHRYHSLDEIYSIPSRVVQGAPALAHWLKTQSNLLLVGPDSESEQWVAEIAAFSQHPFVIGEKQRFGDRHNIQCVAVHGIFADHSDKILLASGLSQLVTSNTIPHPSNAIDITSQLIAPVISMLKLPGKSL